MGKSKGSKGVCHCGAHGYANAVVWCRELFSVGELLNIADECGVVIWTMWSCYIDKQPYISLFIGFLVYNRKHAGS